MKALIIYETISSALKAIISLRNADSSAGQQTPWKIKLWRIGLMRFPSMAGEALHESSDTNLILCAVRRTQALPSWMKHWLERWAMHRKIADAAVALMVDDAHDTGQVALANDMSKFSADHNLTFVANSEQKSKAEAPFAYCRPPGQTLIVASHASNQAEELNKLGRIVNAP
jgi:hypothetical protein